MDKISPIYSIHKIWRSPVNFFCVFWFFKAESKKIVHGEEACWLSNKEKVSWQSVKRWMLTSLLEHKRTYHYKKKKLWFLWPISYFLNEPYIYIYMLHSHNHDTYTTIHIYIRKHSQHNNDERTHFFRKIYLSHFIRNSCERVMCERWVGDWTNCNTLTPSSSGYSSTSFSFCWAAQLGVTEDGKPSSWELVLTASNCNNWLQINWTSCRTGLYHCLPYTCFLWASHLHPIQPVHSQGYPLISSTGCTCSLIYGWVGGQYVTYI